MRQVARSRRAATGFCPGGPTAHLRKRIFIDLWLRPARRGYVQATVSPGIRSVFDLLRHTPIASTSRTGSRSVPLEPALALHRQAPPSTHAAMHALVWHAQKLHVRAISGLRLGSDSASLKPSTMQLRGPGCTCLHHPDARRLRGRNQSREGMQHCISCLHRLWTHAQIPDGFQPVHMMAIAEAAASPRDSTLQRQPASCPRTSMSRCIERSAPTLGKSSSCTTTPG